MTGRINHNRPALRVKDDQKRQISGAYESSPAPSGRVAGPPIPKSEQNLKELRKAKKENRKYPKITSKTIRLRRKLAKKALRLLQKRR